MAEPQKKQAAQASTVSSCSATDCAHNENHNCHAGSIRVEMRGGEAICGTYTTEAPAARP